MSRITALWQANPRRVLATTCALAIASAAMVTSGANFTSASANPQVVIAGNLSHTNSKDGAAVFTASKLKPGQSASGTVTITNDGDITGALKLTQGSLSDSASFGSKLDLVIADGATQVYSGKFNAMPAQTLGSLAVGAAKTYTFTVSFPDGGTGGADNAYKGATAQATFNWETTS